MEDHSSTQEITNAEIGINSCAETDVIQLQSMDQAGTSSTPRDNDSNNSDDKSGSDDSNDSNNINQLSPGSPPSSNNGNEPDAYQSPDFPPVPSRVSSPEDCPSLSSISDWKEPDTKPIPRIENSDFQPGVHVRFRHKGVSRRKRMGDFKRLIRDELDTKDELGFRYYVSHDIDYGVQYLYSHDYSFEIDLQCLEDAEELRSLYEDCWKLDVEDVATVKCSGYHAQM